MRALYGAISQTYSLVTPLKFNIAPVKWWLEDEFPFEIAYFFRLYVKFPGCTNFHHDPTKVWSPSPSIFSTPPGQGRLLLHNQRHGDMDYTLTQGNGQRCPRNIPGPWHRFTKEQPTKNVRIETRRVFFGCFLKWWDIPSNHPFYIGCSVINHPFWW